MAKFFKQRQIFVLIMMFIMLWANAAHALQNGAMSIVENISVALSAACYEKNAVQSAMHSHHQMVIQNQQQDHRKNQQKTLAHECHQNHPQFTDTSTAHADKIACQECLTLHCLMNYSALLPVDFNLNPQDTSILTQLDQTPYQSYWQHADLAQILRPPQA